MIVTAADADGNVATSYATAVPLGIKSGTGTTGATLAGTVTAVTPVNGVAKFSTLTFP